MTCININNGFICLSNDSFTCPTCKKQYSGEKYIDRCNKNKNGCTRVKCECGQLFYMTYNYRGDAVSFLNTKTL
jgi:hypothetical protein